MRTQVAVVDYGSQYTQLIVRRVRELGYYARLYQLHQIGDITDPAGIILSGGPRSTKEKDAPDIDFAWLKGKGVPVLGICYGMQLLNLKHGGEVTPGHVREYGPAKLQVADGSDLLKDLRGDSQIWMSHSDFCSRLADGCQVLGTNEEGHPVAVRWGRDFFGIQFHPEVTHSHEGVAILRNFLSLLPEPPAFSITSFKEEILSAIRAKVAGRHVVCGVSGGVDSTVLAALLHEAGVSVNAIFVDTGLLRKGEREEVEGQFREIGIQIDTVDAGARFLAALAGEADPEKKRKIIGNLFLDVFFDHAGEIELFAQGTLYPDVIESATSGSIASKIKTHHNRVDRVMELNREGRVIEPLAELFKDEVRKLGEALGIPHRALWRHPFPGPGLAVRCPGEVTAEKLAILREADAIFTDVLRKSGWYEKIWQACTTLIPAKTVGVKGDERAYEYPVSLRAVISEDAMTADWVEIPHAVLREASNRILNGVKHVNRVLYDISTKPPASIEWE